MKRATDKLTALQCLAVALPIAVVLLVQMAVDVRRAASLDQSRPLRILAAEARAYYKIFLNGADDAADTGSLGTRSVEALHSSAGELAGLAIIDGRASVADAAAVVGGLESIIPKGATLETLTPLRARMVQGDLLTKAIDDEYQGRDELVVREAVASGVRQKYAVAGALILTTDFHPGVAAQVFGDFL